MAILPKCPNLQSLLIPGDKKQRPVPLVDHVNDVLYGVVQQATILLGTHDQLSDSRTGRPLGRFKSLRLALDRETIDNMVKSVEGAHHHLHIALIIASINASIS